MRKTTAALTASILGAGSAVLLSVAVPGVASASCDTPEQVTQLDPAGWQIPDAGNTGTGGEASIVREPAGYNLVLNGTANYVRASYPVSVAYGGTVPGGLPLAGQTDPSQYGYEYQRFDGGAIDAGAPTYQLVLDYNGPEATGGFTTLVYEPVYQTSGRTNTWWSTQDLPGWTNGAGGHGSRHGDWGTLQEISAAFPNATIESFGVAQSKGGQASIDSVTFGCNTFEFRYENAVPTASFTVTDAGDSNYRTFKFVNGATDLDGDTDTLTYLWNFGDGTTSTEADPGHTYPAQNPWNYNVTLTVTDEAGASHTAGPWVVEVRIPAPTTQDEALAGTGADVMGLAGIGGLVVLAAGAGLVANRRRNASHSA